jgi:hypothetical protein
VAPATRVKGVANTRTHTQTQTHTCSRASHTIVRVPHGATQEGGCGPVDFVKKKNEIAEERRRELGDLCHVDDFANLNVSFFIYFCFYYLSFIFFLFSVFFYG